MSLYSNHFILLRQPTRDKIDLQWPRSANSPSIPYNQITHMNLRCFSARAVFKAKALIIVCVLLLQTPPCVYMHIFCLPGCLGLRMESLSVIIYNKVVLRMDPILDECTHLMESVSEFHTHWRPSGFDSTL